MEKEQKTIRLTIRLPEELDSLIRNEAEKRGKNVNQMMVHMLNEYIKNQKE